jgi:hypothetical protein
MKTTEITLAEYRALREPKKAPGRQKRARSASIPTAAPEPRTPAGWGADYDEAGRRGWFFTQNASECWGWKPGGLQTARYPLRVYASAAGTLRGAVVAALEVGE